MLYDDSYFEDHLNLATADCMRTAECTAAVSRLIAVPNAWTTPQIVDDNEAHPRSLSDAIQFVCAIKRDFAEFWLNSETEFGGTLEEAIVQLIGSPFAHRVVIDRHDALVRLIYPDDKSRQLQGIGKTRGRKPLRDKVEELQIPDAEAVITELDKVRDTVVMAYRQKRQAELMKWTRPDARKRRRTVNSHFVDFHLARCVTDRSIESIRQSLALYQIEFPKKECPGETTALRAVKNRMRTHRDQ